MRDRVYAAQGRIHGDQAKNAGELAGRGDPDAVEPDGGRRPDPPDPLDRERVQESEPVPG